MANKARTWYGWGDPTVKNFQELRNNSAHEYAYNDLVVKYKDGLFDTDNHRLLKRDLETLIESEYSPGQEVSKEISKILTRVEWNEEYRIAKSTFFEEFPASVEDLAKSLGGTISDKAETAQNFMDKHCPWVNDFIAGVSQNTEEAINNLNHEFPKISILLQEMSDKTSNFMADFNAMEATEFGMNSLAGGISAALISAIYSALKEFLSLEGKRRKGEISNGEVAKQVCQIALEAAKKGVGVGVIFAIAIMIFGNWLLIPLSFIAPFATIKMSASLWESFWDGLDEYQRQELIERADELKIDISNLFSFA